MNGIASVAPAPLPVFGSLHLLWRVISLCCHPEHVFCAKDLNPCVLFYANHAQLGFGSKALQFSASHSPAIRIVLARALRNRAKYVFARAISFAICSFNSSAPANFFSARNLFQNRTAIRLGVKFPE
jgi:hypothetical protein